MTTTTEPTATPTERRVYDCMVRLDLWLTAVQLADLTGASELDVQAALDALQADGAIERADCDQYRAV